MLHERPNYVLAGHVGIIGHDRIMVSLAKPHYTNQGIKEPRSLTVNIADEAIAGMEPDEKRSQKDLPLEAGRQKTVQMMLQSGLPILG